jgi:hypothetical protein
MAQPMGRRDAPGAAAGRDLKILDASTVVATIIVAPDGRIVGANPRMRQFLGLTAVHAETGASRLGDFLVDAAVWTAWRAATPAPQAIEVSLRGCDGTERFFRGDLYSDGDGSERRIVAVLVDGEDGKALRAVAQHGARMEALGSLTAGVAHDFNNLLTVLVGNLYLVAEELREQPEVFAKLKAARDAGKRGADLVKQLMTFARREELEVGAIDPVKVVTSLTPLLRRALGARINLETEFHERAGAVRASAAQLESVVVNLAINARDAIEGKGRVAVEVDCLDVREHEAPLRGVRSGRYIAVRVRDTGGGIAPQSLSRVFEPFFSTKRDRGGTGLGLSMVRWFAEQSGGAATIESVVGQGTTVTVLLPQLAEPAIDASEKTMPLSTLPSGDERVVVLALDEALRATIHQTLGVLGYRVKVAAGTEDLLAAVAAEPTQLLVVDGLGRGDADVLIRARALQPEIKIIATVDPVRAAERIAVTGLTALTKPFSLADLASAVRCTLDVTP